MVLNRSTSLLSTIPGEKLQSCSIRPGEAVVHRQFDHESTGLGRLFFALFCSPPLSSIKIAPFCSS